MKYETNENIFAHIKTLKMRKNSLSYMCRDNKLFDKADKFDKATVTQCWTGYIFNLPTVVCNILLNYIWILNCKDH